MESKTHFPISFCNFEYFLKTYIFRDSMPNGNLNVKSTDLNLFKCTCEYQSFLLTLSCFHSNLKIHRNTFKKIALENKEALFKAEFKFRVCWEGVGVSLVDVAYQEVSLNLFLRCRELTFDFIIVNFLSCSHSNQILLFSHY